jgi:hypothetical protein
LPEEIEETDGNFRIARYQARLEYGVVPWARVKSTESFALLRYVIL